jgi:hypothetical protein
MRTTMNLGLTLVALAASGCMMNGTSRTATGQLYTSGNPTYDTFFHDVHQQQVDAAGWGDDKKGAHRSLVAALELTPDAPDVTLVQATHEAASKVAKLPGSVKLDVDGTTAHVVASGGASDGGALFRAIEDTTHGELERAKRMHAVGPKLDALSNQASVLEGRVKSDFEKNGLNKENEVAGELMSSTDVILKLKSHAESEARESDDFVADLERAVETASEASAAKVVARHDTMKKKRDKGEKADKSDTASPPSKPSTPSGDSSPPPPKPAAPAPKPADTGEVFTP